MRVLLVHPRFPITYWGFQHGLALDDRSASLPPLGLCTVAAELPQGWPLRLVDLNIRPLDDADLAWAEAVLVGGMRVQASSMHEVVARARALGRRTVVGGPAATTAPGDFDDADVVFAGELEGRAAELVAALAGPRGIHQVLTSTADVPDIGLARVPRFDLLDVSRYASMSLQYSRGCPYQCEFCDVIVLFGRVPRVKSNRQVLAELDALRALGFRGSVFFVDDNFIGNVRAVRALLPELRRWQERHGRPFEFYTEASVNLAADPALVADLVACGFTSVFLGIETPNAEALRAAGKLQNLRQDLTESVESLTRAGLEVMGGFIVGFDTDSPDGIAEILRFLEDAPIPLAMVGVLTALPGTALWRRLSSEGRLRRTSSGDQFDRPNFEPRMDEAALLAGYAELLARLYSADGYQRRCLANLERGVLPRGAGRGALRDLPTVARCVWRLGVVGPRRRLFWTLLGRALARSPRGISWALRHAIMGEHLIRYTEEDVLPRLRRALGEISSELDRPLLAGQRGEVPLAGVELAPQA